MGESIGERIARLRNSKGWSRPELGRQMAKAIEKKKPFSGEAVRRYEENIDRPGRDARTAIAKAFERSEAYIEFGDSGQGRSARNTAAQTEATYSSEDPRAQNAREEILLLLYRGLFSLQQERLIVGLRALFDANQITRKELNQKPLRGVSDDQVRDAFGDAPFQRMKRRGKTTPPGRDLGDAMGDVFGDQ